MGVWQSSHRAALVGSVWTSRLVESVWRKTGVPGSGKAVTTCWKV